MQLQPLTEEGKAMLAQAVAAERERKLKYDRAIRKLHRLGALVPNLMGATIYAKLEEKGYVWDAGAEQWVRMPQTQVEIGIGSRVRVLRSTDPYHVGRLGTVLERHDGTGALRVDIDLAWMHDWLQPCDLELVAGEGEDTEAQKQTAAAR